MSIQVQGIRKTFGAFVAVDDVSLDFPTGKLIALLGVKDLVIVDTPDALLIADRSRSQEVGDIVKELEQKHHHLL